MTTEENQQQSASNKAKWYTIHTYSGYEEQVAENLKQRIDSMNVSDKIFDVIVPKEKNIEIKDGKRKIIDKKLFPGYVMVKMIVAEDSWYVVRNTPNVTGFIGFGTKPSPISNQEVSRIQKRMSIEEPEYKINVRAGEHVRITDGPFNNFEGVVDSIDEKRGKIKVNVSIFGRETPVNLDFLQIKKL
ncbi:transcription termination/antitermination protein NusG [Patescibacteria group bacterium]